MICWAALFPHQIFVCGCGEFFSWKCFAKCGRSWCNEWRHGRRHCETHRIVCPCECPRKVGFVKIFYQIILSDNVLLDESKSGEGFVSASSGRFSRVDDGTNKYVSGTYHWDRLWLANYLYAVVASSSGSITVNSNRMVSFNSDRGFGGCTFKIQVPYSDSFSKSFLLLFNFWKESLNAFFGTKGGNILNLTWVAFCSLSRIQLFWTDPWYLETTVSRRTGLDPPVFTAAVGKNCWGIFEQSSQDSAWRTSHTCWYLATLSFPKIHCLPRVITPSPAGVSSWKSLTTQVSSKVGTDNSVSFFETTWQKISVLQGWYFTN